MNNVVIGQAPSSRTTVWNQQNPSFLRQPHFKNSTSTLLNQHKTNEIANSLAAKLPIELHYALQEVSFQNGQTIYDFGDAIDYIYFPQNCVAMRLNLLEDGSMVEVGIIGKEGILGSGSLLGNKISSDWLIAEIGGKALRIRADVLRDFFRCSEEWQNLFFKFYENFLGQISQRSACRCRHSIAEQLSTWLLLLDERMNGKEIPLTHETIARRLGARRAGITVSMNELENARAIKCGRGKISVNNRKILEGHACECYSVLNEPFRK